MEVGTKIILIIGLVLIFLRVQIYWKSSIQNGRLIFEHGWRFPRKIFQRQEIIIDRIVDIEYSKNGENKNWDIQYEESGDIKQFSISTRDYSNAGYTMKLIDNKIKKPAL